MKDRSIRKLSLEEIKAASSLIWKSFYYAEKDRFSLDGMEKFRDLTSTAVLQYEVLYNGMVIAGSFSQEKLCGVIAFKDNRVILLFVDHQFQKQRIGSDLLFYFLSRQTQETVYVNASPGAVSFYLKNGFVSCGEETDEEGLLFVPMRGNALQICKKLTSPRV